MKLRPGPRRNERGSILLLTILFLVIINLFAVAYFKIVPVEMNAARRHLLETQAYFASDAGIVDALAFLEEATVNGNLDALISAAPLNGDGHREITRSGDTGDWDWQCTITPDAETLGYAGVTSPDPLRVYKLEATATRPGMTGDSHKYRQVTCWVKQKTFAEYNWNNAQSNGQLWLFMDTFTIDGTYRTNGQGLLRIENTDLWSAPQAAIGGEFIFGAPFDDPDLGYVDGVRYSNYSDATTPYDNTGVAIPERYDKISMFGRSGVRQEEQVPLPVSSDNVAFGIYGSSPPADTDPLLDVSTSFFGSDTGTRVNARIPGATPGGDALNGIYISGDVDQIEYQASDTDGDTNFDDENQIIRIYQGGGADEYVEVTHVQGRDYTIPAGARVVDNTHSAGSTLSPTANGGDGYTVIRRANAGATEDNILVYNGQTNGAIFATGDVNGVRGTVLGRRTVAVATDSGSTTARDKEIRINGHLRYAGTTDGDYPSTASETMLALIGYAVRIEHDPATAAPTNANPQLGRMWPNRDDTNDTNPLYLYTSIFTGRDSDPATGTAQAIREGGGFGSSRPGGPWHGAQHDGTAFGKGFFYIYGSVTEGIRQHKGTGSTRGNSYKFFDDTRLRNTQPPFFPSLPSYDILLWDEKSVFSY